MLCCEKCPRKLTNCKPIANVVPNDLSSIVCVGYHDGKKKSDTQDRFRHCFKSHVTDTMFDYDEYDLKSVSSVFMEAILMDEINNRA